MNNLEKWVMNEMIKNLQKYEGVRTHPSDIAFLLFDDYMSNTSEAIEWIHDYFGCLSDVVKYFAEYPIDILFSHPERFKLAVTILLAQQLDTLSPYIAKRIERDEEILLTPLTIKTIINEWQEAMD